MVVWMFLFEPSHSKMDKMGCPFAVKIVIGRNTTHMLQSGMLYGYSGMIDNMVGRIRNELGTDARVVATGGLAHVIASETKTIEQVEPFLTLQGLRLIFERNRDTHAASRGAPMSKEDP